MFTGIITGVGRIAALHDLGSSLSHGKRLTLEVPAGYLDDVGLGDSIAINGACMTVTSFDVATHQFTIDISAESLDKTCGLDKLGKVNLEKALRAHDRLGGHIVSGHVDGIGKVTYFAQVGESWGTENSLPCHHGQVLGLQRLYHCQWRQPHREQCFDLAEGCEFSINLIPHTVENTALGTLQAGSPVNLEIDLIARYVERMLNNDASANSAAAAFKAASPH
jgi:riboflavin synthase